MTSFRKEKYKLSGVRLLQHLDNVLDADVGYPDKTSWGYAFTYLAALFLNDDEGDLLAKKALFHLDAQDKNDPNYSWEFVVYAIQMSKKIKLNSIPDSVDGYKKKGTRMFNWFLLRRLNRRLCDCFDVVDYAKLRLASVMYQQSSGLILDEFKTRSLQYHAFCLFLLAELIDADPGNMWLVKWFKKGVAFSMRHVLTDGSALYIGRGQEQIFGYGALLYAVEYCHANICKLDANVIESLSDRLLGFQRMDGSYPLVLRCREPELPNARFSSEIPPGWYGYNTLFDYQPFLAYCLLKASKIK